MKNSANIIQIIVFSAISVVAAVFFWPFSVAGVIAYLVSGMRCKRWVASVFGLVVAIGWRLAAGEWPLRIGDGSSGYWFVEVACGIVNWAFAAILVRAFMLWPIRIVEGYRSMAGRTV